MSDTKFTPGKWKVEYGDLVVIGDIRFEMNSEHDAHLIAAAPEMYAMLEKLHHESRLVYGDDYDLVEELLAKARGEV